MHDLLHLLPSARSYRTTRLVRRLLHWCHLSGRPSSQVAQPASLRANRRLAGLQVSSRRLRAAAVAAASVVWPALRCDLARLAAPRRRRPRRSRPSSAASSSPPSATLRSLLAANMAAAAAVRGQRGPQRAVRPTWHPQASAPHRTPLHMHTSPVLAAGTPSKCKARAEQPTACRVPPSQWFAANVDWRPTLPGLPPVVSSGLPAPMQGEGASPESPSRASRLKV